MASVHVAPTGEVFVEEKPEQLRPSEVASPTVIDTVPQQASTSPGDGTEEVHTSSDAVPQGQNIVQTQEQPQRKLSFKEQVIGYAKVTRGTLLRKPEVKEHGEKILDGQATVQEPASM